jgi:hypothetical protein
MKTTVLAIALALATMPFTFAAQTPPAKTTKSADKTTKKNHKKTPKKGSDSTSTPASTPVKK